MITKGTWVRVHKILVNPEDRSPNLPEDTKKVPVELWTKGYLQKDSEIGEEVQIKTITNRIEKGELIEANPSYSHNYGSHIPEIMEIGIQLKKILFGGDTDER